MIVCGLGRPERVDEERSDDAERVVSLLLGHVHLRIRHRAHHVGDRLRDRAQRCDRSFPGLDVAHVGEHREDHERAVELLGQERHRRRRHHVRDRRELVGRRLRLGDERRDRLGRGRQEEQSPHDRADVVQSKMQAGRDAEVAAPAPDRPEQIGVMLVVDVQHLPVGGHDLGGEQGIDREPVRPGEEPDATAERDAADADRAGIAEPGREAVLGRRRRVLAGGQARLRPRGAFAGIDLQRAHVDEVDHERVVDHAVAGAAVSAPAHAERRLGLACERHGPRDVARVGHPGDRGRPTIHAAVEELS